MSDKTSNQRLLQAIETGLAAMRDCQRNSHGGKVCFDGDEWHERWALLSEARRTLRCAVETSVTNSPLAQAVLDRVVGANLGIFFTSAVDHIEKGGNEASCEVELTDGTKVELRMSRVGSSVEPTGESP